MSSKLIYGVGLNDRKYPVKVEGKSTKVYNLWLNLLTRCYNSKTHKTSPTYVGCSVSENFKNFTYFYEWCQKQIGFNQEGFQLDKDLILRGNKIYSEDTCLFLPRELNSLLTAHKAARGSFPLGVSLHCGKFKAQCLRHPAPTHIGLFNTPDEAFQAYKQAKETFIKLQAEKWKARIDPRAYAALMAYEVLPTD